MAIKQLPNITHKPGANALPINVSSLSLVPPWPWENMSVWRLMTWMMTGSRQKSENEVTCLIHEVLQSEDFDHTHLNGFNAYTQMKKFDKSEGGEDSTNMQQDAWKELSVHILVPMWEHNLDSNGQPFTIPGLFYCSLTGVIHTTFSEKALKWFHLTPFKCIWRSPITGQEQCVYDELYTSDAWITAHDDLQKQRCEDEYKLEYVIAGLMIWSDATHLAQFGNASAWPVYLCFGNQSKYTQATPDSGACHPIAFIPTVSFVQDGLFKPLRSNGTSCQTL